MAPIVIGYAPFAFVLGSAIAAHAEPVAGWAGIWPIFGGSAHLSVLRAVDEGAGALLAIAIGLLVHARLALYSASLAPKWHDQPTWFRLVAAAILIDPTWALADARASRPGSAADYRRYYLAAALTLGIGWTLMVTVGTMLGHRIGGGFGLDLTIPLCMVGLVGPRLIRWSDAGIAAAAGVVVWSTSAWPAGTGLLLAIGAGVAVGALAEGRSR